MNRIVPAREIECGVGSRALPGQTVSGDLHLVKSFRQGVLVGVVDGVGHGDEAAAAARMAVATLSASPAESVIRLMERCHAVLAQSRGAVITLASFDHGEGTLSLLGVGNVEGVLLRADPKANPAKERVLLRAGLVGCQLPLLHASVISIHRGDLLVLASDGIRAEFDEGLHGNREPAQQIAERLLAGYFKGTDDALVLVARYPGRDHE